MYQPDQPDQSFTIRDLRTRPWFWTHQDIWPYVPLIGPAAYTVYSAILSHADNQTQTCYPSLSRLERLTNLSRKTVIQAIAILEATRLLRVERQRNGTTRLTNIYSILEIPELTPDLVLAHQDAIQQIRQKGSGHTPPGGVVYSLHQGSGHTPPGGSVLTPPKLDSWRTRLMNYMGGNAQNQNTACRDDNPDPPEHITLAGPSHGSSGDQQTLPLCSDDHAFTEHDHGPPPREVPPPRTRSKARTTQLLDAYTEAVTGRGWVANKAGAKGHLNALVELDCQPDQIDDIIAWATAGQRSRRAYPLRQLPDDVRSWQAEQAKRPQRSVVSDYPPRTDHADDALRVFFGDDYDTDLV